MHSCFWVCRMQAIRRTRGEESRSMAGIRFSDQAKLSCPTCDLSTNFIDRRHKVLQTSQNHYALIVLAPTSYVIWRSSALVHCKLRIALISPRATRANWACWRIRRSVWPEVQEVYRRFCFGSSKQDLFNIIISAMLLAACRVHSWLIPLAPEVKYSRPSAKSWC